jgi:LytS/YehU family sensor histidine kinase
MNVLKSENIFQFNLNFENWKFYLFTLLFVGGNLFFPWLVHSVPMGGPKFLPIYFFVLIGAYKFGLKVGLSTAILSPLANHFLTGMPATSMLPTIFVKGILMALFAYFIAMKTKKISIIHVGIVVIAYQLIGMIFEAVYTMSFTKAFQDIVIGYPGLLIQVFGGFLLLSLLRNYGNKNSESLKSLN